MKRFPFAPLALALLAGCGTAPTVASVPTKSAYDEQMAILKGGGAPGQPSDPNAIKKLIQQQGASNRLIEGMKRPGADPAVLMKQFTDDVKKLQPPK